MPVRNHFQFFLGWMRSPRAIGAILPSSQALSQGIAAQVSLKHPGHIIELGGGTGSLTQKLLESGIEPSRLLIIEREQTFVDILQKRFPELSILHEDATKLRGILAQHHITDVNCIISGLPLLSLPLDTRDAILDDSLSLLNADNYLIQFTYGLHSPIPKALWAKYQITGKAIKRIWRNLPPATIWRYQKLW